MNDSRLTFRSGKYQLKSRICINRRGLAVPLNLWRLDGANKLMIMVRWQNMR